MAIIAVLLRVVLDGAIRNHDNVRMAVSEHLLAIAVVAAMMRGQKDIHRRELLAKVIVLNIVSQPARSMSPGMTAQNSPYLTNATMLRLFMSVKRGP